MTFATRCRTGPLEERVYRDPDGVVSLCFVHPIPPSSDHTVDAVQDPGFSERLQHADRIAGGGRILRLLDVGPISRRTLVHTR